jgi:hypothetical protein
MACSDEFVLLIVKTSTYRIGSALKSGIAHELNLRTRHHFDPERLACSKAQPYCLGQKSIKNRAEEPSREERITMDIVVDANNNIERASGWYCYLEDQLNFPFAGICEQHVSTSPLKPGDKIEVLEMADIDVCDSDMLVTIRCGDGNLDIPLRQIEPVNTAPGTEQAIED